MANVFLFEQVPEPISPSEILIKIVSVCAYVAIVFTVPVAVSQRAFALQDTIRIAKIKYLILSPIIDVRS